MNNFITVMTAAGAGSRFRKKASMPKPYIGVAGSPTMIDHVMMRTKAAGNHIYLVAQAAHRPYVEMLQNFPMERVALIPPMIDAGPAGSVIMGMNSIMKHASSDTGFMLMDCDSFVEPDGSGLYTYPHLRKLLENLPEVTRCAVMTVEAEYPRKEESSVFSGNRPWIVEGGVEKGGRVNTGIYWFRSFAEFRTVAFELWSDIKRPVGEVKISHIMNHIHLNHGQRVCAEVFLEDGQFINLGTPDQLDAYVAGYIA